MRPSLLLAVALSLCCLQGTALAQGVAEAGRVSNANQGQTLIYENDSGRHIVVGGDPAHGIYHNPAGLKPDNSSVKCAGTAYGCAYPPPPPSHHTPSHHR